MKRDEDRGVNHETSAVHMDWGGKEAESLPHSYNLIWKLRKFRNGKPAQIELMGEGLGTSLLIVGRDGNLLARIAGRDLCELIKYAGYRIGPIVRSRNGKYVPYEGRAAGRARSLAGKEKAA